MNEIVKELLLLLEHSEIKKSDVITWGAPIPSFGDASRAIVATLGLNPSNKEFVDNAGNEIGGELRRFHTLNSLNLKSWQNASDLEVKKISDSCTEYFLRNPYNSWFKSLDQLISGTSASYYNKLFHAVHLDLIPLATHSKWSDLSTQQKNVLIDLTSNILGKILRETPVKIILLNGRTVIENLQKVSKVTLNVQHMPEWDLKRENRPSIRGLAYKGFITEISQVELNRRILVLGFNHNIQSSYGVSSGVRSSIQKWITDESKGIL